MDVQSGHLFAWIMFAAAREKRRGVELNESVCVYVSYMYAFAYYNSIPNSICFHFDEKKRLSRNWLLAFVSNRQHSATVGSLTRTSSAANCESRIKPAARSISFYEITLHFNLFERYLRIGNPRIFAGNAVSRVETKLTEPNRTEMMTKAITRDAFKQMHRTLNGH